MHPFVPLLARLILGLTWAVAGIAKLAAPGPVRDAAATFGLLRPSAARLAATVLPWVELSLGVLLLAGLWTVPAAAASGVLLGAFTVSITVNLVRGRRIECHCFGQLSRGRISWLTVARNLGLLAAALIVALTDPKYFAIDGWRHGMAVRAADPPIVEFVPVLLLALAALLLWALGVSAWEAARAMGQAEQGPALGLPEYRIVRRWLRIDGSHRSGENGG